MVTPNETTFVEGNPESPPIQVGIDQPMVVPPIEGEDGFASLDAVPLVPDPSMQQPNDTGNRDRQELNYLRAERNEQEIASATNDRLRAFQAELQQRGYSAQEQEYFLARENQTYQEVIQERQGFRQQQQIQQGKINAAQFYGKQYGIDPAVLMDSGSPEAMREVGAREQRYAEQERRIQTLEQGRVPAQALNSVGTSQATGVTVTSDNIDLLHSQNRISDEAYRNFLRTQRG
jgi:hypothetical protein